MSKNEYNPYDTLFSSPIIIGSIVLLVLSTVVLIIGNVYHNQHIKETEVVIDVNNLPKKCINGVLYYGTTKTFLVPAFDNKTKNILTC